MLQKEYLHFLAAIFESSKNGLFFSVLYQLEQRLLKTAKEKMEQLSRALKGGK